MKGFVTFRGLGILKHNVRIVQDYSVIVDVLQQHTVWKKKNKKKTLMIIAENLIKILMLCSAAAKTHLLLAWCMEIQAIKLSTLPQPFLCPVCTSEPWVIQTEATCPLISKRSVFSSSSPGLGLMNLEQCISILLGNSDKRGNCKRKRESVIKVVNSWKNSDTKESWYKRLVSVLWTHTWLRSELMSFTFPKNANLVSEPCHSGEIEIKWNILDTFEEF